MKENLAKRSTDDISSKFDLLARQVLKTSGILPLLPKHWFHHDDSKCNSNHEDNDNHHSQKNEFNALPRRLLYVNALERVLDIEQKEEMQKYDDIRKDGHDDDDKNENDNSCTAKLLTCTDFNTSTSTSTLVFGMKNNDDNDLPQYWTPTTSEYEEQIITTNDNDMHVVQPRLHQLDDIPSLEEMAPFSRKFYLSVAQLLAFTYTQSNSIITAASSKLSSSSMSTSLHNQRHSHSQPHQASCSNVIQNYSLPFDVYTVRVTRILSTLMDLNVMGEFRIHDDNHSHDHNENNDNDNDHNIIFKNIIRKRKLQNDDNFDHEEDETISFMDLFLYYVEQNSILFQQQHLDHNTVDNNNNNDNFLDDTESSKNHIKSAHSTPTHNIPFLQSLFKYYSNLPQLESHIYTIVRLHRSYNTNNMNHNNNNKNMDAKVQQMKMTQLLQDRLEKELEAHLSLLEHIIGMLYIKCDVTLRKKVRLLIGYGLHTFVLRCSSSPSPGIGGPVGGGLVFGMGVENTSATGVDVLLKILLRILQGISLRSRQSASGDEHHYSNIPLRESHLHLLFDVLMPLHKPSGMVLWRDQKPILGLYHKSLVQCIGSIVSFDTSLIGKVIQYLLHPDVWPSEGGSESSKGSKMANTPKVVLLLHEIDTLIGLLKIDPYNNENPEEGSNVIGTLFDAIVPLVARLSYCISSENSRTSEMALKFFKNDKFKALVKLHIQILMTPLIRALCRIDSGMEIPWNPTVRKMTLLVLQELQRYDEAQFKKSCSEVLSKTRKSGVKVKRESVTGSAQTQSSNTQAPTADMMSLRKSMGSWKPPAKHNKNHSTVISSVQSIHKGNTSSTPPLTVTGVAPWSIKETQMASKSQPPLTVTGVAPWSMRQMPNRGNAKSFHVAEGMKPRVRKSQLPTGITYIRNDKEEAPPNLTVNGRIEEAVPDNITANAVARINDFIDQLKKSGSNDEEETDADGISKWAKSQMEASPLLLPSLKFHDLVFGQVLGRGSFSSVKYARQIVKGKTRSYWPEFAVKIVSTQKIEELGYETSVNREIGILSILSHPGIARLVSSFKFREGAYLVLEYASRGDLYNLLKENGSLDEVSTRFVIGQLVAALHSIHELGFVFVDLKPENILITESGHVKITDFGGCRALTENAKKLLKITSTNLLKNLRDGDWRCTSDESNRTETFTNEDESDNEDFEDDIRIEGTTAYLPPEVILGGFPSFSTDSWALGCVFYQCLAGRPPLLGENELSTKQRIVSFTVQESNASGITEDLFFTDGSDGSVFSSAAKNLIKQLFSSNPNDRPSMTTISEHSFFDGLDVFNLYKQSSCRLDAGRITPKPDAAWTRRQFSSIWAPQPVSYDLTKNTNLDLKNSKDVSSPIQEGDEIDGFFLITKTQKAKRPLLFGIQEGVE